MKNSYSQLEFDKVKHLIAEYCHCTVAAKRASGLGILSSKEEVQHSLDIITECTDIVGQGFQFDFEHISEIKPILFHFQYAAYSFEEFSRIYYTVKTAIEIIDFTEKEETCLEACSCFKALCKQLTKLPEIASRFKAVFSHEGEVLDTASPELKQIRQRQFSLRKSILNKLDSKLNEKGLENIIQDKIITQREGRYVIPLKDGGINTVPGIVHGYSGSRATIFVEPNDVVGHNNELHSLKRDEEEEIYRIFCDFTALILGLKEEIFQNNLVLSELDYYFACAKLGMDFESHKPKLSSKYIVNLANARHPLLIHNYRSIKKVIPFDLELGESKKILVLSGPNTGGKTITLKSVGLLVLMTLCGLPIPADEDSEIGFFENIFTDINDDQSIENSLSTFSSHIDRLKTMLRQGNSRTLVLIDEIGSATDPEQGSALAQSIMEKLVELKVIGVITTHYTPLKIFAEKSDYCINAAMQFDPQKHQPTYYFKVGLPGNSFALEIASKLGLAKDVMDRAKELTGKKNVELTNLITAVALEKKELTKLKQDAELKQRQLQAKINEYESIIDEIESQKKEIRKKTIAEAGSFLTNIRRELNSELEAVVSADKKERKEKAKQLLHEVGKIQQGLSEQSDEMMAEELIPAEKISLGDSLWVKEFSETGRVVSIDKDKVTVDINNIYFTTTKESLYQSVKAGSSYANKTEAVYRRKEKKADYQPTGLKTELKLLGLTYDEALPLVERFIDDGYTAGLNSLRIVHGKGTGALRSKIRNYLKKLDFVEDFYSPSQQMGGAGVTIVNFQESKP